MPGTFAPKRSVIAAGLLTALLLTACSDPPDPRTDDVPTRGHILILADEDLRDLVQAEEYMFESIYRDAQLDIRYLPEAELLKAVMNDSVRCWIGTVQPGGEQEAYYAKRSIKAHVIPIAMDGIAVVVSKVRRQESISTPTIQRLLITGDQAPKQDSSGIEVVWYKVLQVPLFAGSGSGIARSLVDSLLRSDGGKVLARALPTVENVVEAIEEDPDRIGFLPFSAISDLDNPKMKAL